MRGSLAKEIRRRERKQQLLQVKMRAAREWQWRQLPWWKRAWVRARFLFRRVEA